VTPRSIDSDYRYPQMYSEIVVVAVYLISLVNYCDGEILQENIYLLDSLEPRTGSGTCKLCDNTNKILRLN
jgi:hypothetical protein